MPKDILVRLADDLAARLAEHKARTLVPTTAFVRRAIERALETAEGIEERSDDESEIIAAKTNSELVVDWNIKG